MENLIKIFNNCSELVKALFVEWLINKAHETNSEFYYNLLDILVEQKDAEYMLETWEAEEFVTL